MNKTDAIRRVMQRGSEYTTESLSRLTGIEPRLIPALLKHDIQMGRIMKNDEWPRTYRLPTVAEEEAPRIKAAIQLLARNGYTVSRAWSARLDEYRGERR